MRRMFKADNRPSSRLQQQAIGQCAMQQMHRRWSPDVQKLTAHHFGDHSARSAMIGSTREARRAGSQHAIITAMPSTMAALMHASRFGAGISAH